MQRHSASVPNCSGTKEEVRSVCVCVRLREAKRDRVSKELKPTLNPPLIPTETLPQQKVK